jgi:hypothetical protein
MADVLYPEKGQRCLRELALITHSFIHEGWPYHLFKAHLSKYHYHVGFTLIIQ